MKTYNIKHQFLSFGSRVTVTDQAENLCYSIETSFLRTPRTFLITDHESNQVSLIAKQPFGFLPSFDIRVRDGKHICITRCLSLIRLKFEIEGSNLDVKGYRMSNSYQIFHGGRLIASVSKEWFKYGSYSLDVLDEDFTELVLSMVIAINYIKIMEKKST